MEKTIKLQKIKRKRKHGYRARIKSHAGKKVIKRRIARKRKRIAI
ncbi:MAG: 50S ribosomal protein L34 [Patescibacteria group bacterium]|nr:50S ribosomal protein L34 [Patescibacteria group bacterium]